MEFWMNISHLLLIFKLTVSDFVLSKLALPQRRQFLSVYSYFHITVITLGSVSRQWEAADRPDSKWTCRLRLFVHCLLEVSWLMKTVTCDWKLRWSMQVNLDSNTWCSLTSGALKAAKKPQVAWDVWFVGVRSIYWWRPWDAVRSTNKSVSGLRVELLLMVTVCVLYRPLLDRAGPCSPHCRSVLTDSCDVMLEVKLSTQWNETHTKPHY